MYIDQSCNETDCEFGPNGFRFDGTSNVCKTCKAIKDFNWVFATQKITPYSGRSLITKILIVWNQYTPNGFIISSYGVRNI